MEGVDLRHAITFSSDTYYYKIGEAFWIAPDSEINPNGIQETAQLFGFGAETGIQLPGERGGIMLTSEDFAARHEANPEAFPRGQWGPGDNTDIAIGQGSVAVTPLQLANAYSTLANGGTVYSPNIVTKVVPPADDEEPLEFGPRVLRELDLPQPVTQEVVDGLLGVTMQEKRDLTQPSGTAFDAFNKPEEGGIAFDLINWPVAGKTGTAEVTGRADNSMFAGFGPSGSQSWGTSVNEPEYTIAVILEESGFGSKHAAPMVARLFDGISTDQVPRALPQDEVDEIYDADSPTEPLIEAVAATEVEQ